MSTRHSWPSALYLIPDAVHGTAADASAATMGNKAWNLLRMAQAGLPVPPALVLGTHYARHRSAARQALCAHGLPALERLCGQVLGDARNPLLVSVRSGAPVSMPGMMETLLNVGLCDATLPGLLRQTGHPRLVWDAYRRLIATYGEVVEGLPPELFERELQQVCDGRDERMLDFVELRALTRLFLMRYADAAGQSFPQDPHEQLQRAVEAVFRSWDADKARAYRALNAIPDDLGTAVTIQRMVFGNAGGRSGAGVGFTRHPGTGEATPWIDFLSNAQGEDVVSGRRNAHGHESMAQLVPQAWSQLQGAAHALEHLMGDMQDFEFTVEDGHFFLLQARNGKRTPLAAARIALDLLDEGLITPAEALTRTKALTPQDLGTVCLAGANSTPARPLAEAASACPGVASGVIALDAAHATASAATGAPVVLVRPGAETGDIAALDASTGMLTVTGARTSHAAVVARQLGKVCLVGCTALHIDPEGRSFQLGDTVLHEGDWLTLDGNCGKVYAGRLDAVLVPDAALQARLAALRQASADTTATTTATITAPQSGATGKAPHTVA